MSTPAAAASSGVDARARPSSSSGRSKRAATDGMSQGLCLQTLHCSTLDDLRNLRSNERAFRFRDRNFRNICNGQQNFIGILYVRTVRIEPLTATAAFLIHVGSGRTKRSVTFRCLTTTGKD